MREGKDHRDFGQLLSRLDQLIVWDPWRPCRLPVFRIAREVLYHAHHANLIPMLLLVSPGEGGGGGARKTYYSFCFPCDFE